MEASSSPLSWLPTRLNHLQKQRYNHRYFRHLALDTAEQTVLNRSSHTCLAKIVIMIHLVKDKTVLKSSKMGCKYHHRIIYNQSETLLIWLSCASLPNSFTFNDPNGNYNPKQNLARNKNKIIEALQTVQVLEENALKYPNNHSSILQTKSK